MIPKLWKDPSHYNYNEADGGEERRPQLKWRSLLENVFFLNIIIAKLEFTTPPPDGKRQQEGKEDLVKEPILESIFYEGRWQPLVFFEVEKVGSLPSSSITFALETDSNFTAISRRRCQILNFCSPKCLEPARQLLIWQDVNICKNPEITSGKQAS